MLPPERASPRAILKELNYHKSNNLVQKLDEVLMATILANRKPLTQPRQNRMRSQPCLYLNIYLLPRLVSGVSFKHTLKENLPFVLEFDKHEEVAGMITRIEACDNVVQIPRGKQNSNEKQYELFKCISGKTDFQSWTI